MDFYTLGTRGFFFRVRTGSFVSSAAGRRHERRSFSRGSLFKTRPKPETAHEKPLAPRVGFYRMDAWKSMLQGKNENIQKVYSICLWICLPWDFCASSWDREIVLKTVRLERSGRAVNWLQSCSAQEVEWKRNTEVSNMPNFRVNRCLLLRPKFVKSIRNFTKA